MSALQGWRRCQPHFHGSNGRCNMLTLTCALFDGRLEEEMELMNKEVQVVRHERLKKYYETCYEEYVRSCCIPTLQPGGCFRISKTMLV